MIIKYWVDLHKFGCAPLYIKGKVFRKVAAIAVPIAVMAIPGLNVIAAGAIGGGLSGLISGGGLKGALIGGLTGGITAGVASGAFKGAFAPGGALGGPLAGAGQGATGQAFMAGRGFTGVSHLSNVGTGMSTRTNCSHKFSFYVWSSGSLLRAWCWSWCNEVWWSIKSW